MATGCQSTKPPKATPHEKEYEEEFVELLSLDPTFVLDIKYATGDNFTHKVVYPVAKCFLRASVAQKLVLVQRDLKKQGLRLKLWDCYRPFSVQQKFWEIMPNENYVAKPVLKDGVPVEGSKHNRGAAVDITLIDKTGKELKMPTPYDDFTEKAHRDYPHNSKTAQKNMKLLESSMMARGFTPFPTEWWHFDGPGWANHALSNFQIQSK